MDELDDNFIDKYKNVIKDSHICLPEGFSIREKLIFYSILLNPEGVWQCGNVIIEYDHVNSSRIFKDEDKFIYNLKSDFRSSYVDLWQKANESYENPLEELKKLIE